jgi:hypothetical protein
MMLSCTDIPKGPAMSMIALVIWISACDRTRADWNWPALYISVLGL